jgi:hypothetical protein
MLAGMEESDTAMAHAQELLQVAQATRAAPGPQTGRQTRRR